MADAAPRPNPAPTSDPTGTRPGRGLLRRRQMLALAGGTAGLAAAGPWLQARGSQPPPDEPEEDPAEEELDIEDPEGGLQQIVWSVRTDAPVAAMSFDDGPHPDLTPRILDILDDFGVNATFMAMGYAAHEHPGLMADIVGAGHEVGHHTWQHKNLATTSNRETRQEMEEGVRLVEEAAGVPVKLFRPPRGRLSEGAILLAAQHRHDIVLWSVSRGALAERSPRRVADYVVDRVGPGDIVDFHDGIGRGTFEPQGDLADELMDRRLTEVDALPQILRRVQEGGIRLRTIGSLMSTHTAPPGR